MMLKITFFIITTLWTLTTILVLIRPKALGACIHDQVVIDNVAMDYGPIRAKRDNENTFDSLKIFTHVDEIDKTLSFNAIANIENALRKVTETLAGIFKVMQVPRKFLLKRQNCKRRWTSGVNEGKCAQIQSDVEHCSVKNTDYIIPGTFLDGLEAYHEADKNPYKKIISGRGIDGYNFILFVISRSDAWCQQQVILHEVLHVLGFSERLFNEFKGCSIANTCDKLSKTTEDDANGIPRLQFSPVIKATQEHFSCNSSQLGAPTSNKQTASHWHPLLMFSSIMVPSFSEDDILVLDKITLSLFESTGWYEINYSGSEHFQFGKGKGCDFISPKACENENYNEFCTVSANKSGCDLMNLGITHCQSVASDQSCGVFKPSMKESCDKQHELEHGIEAHELDYSQKCFITQTGGGNPEPKCLFIKCSSENSYEVLYNSTWMPCDNAKKASDGQTVVNCISDLPICQSQIEKVTTSVCDPDTNYVISLRMYFLEPTYADLIKKGNLKFFKVKMIHAVANAIEIPVSYIVNATLSVFRQVFLDFCICSPQDLSNTELGRIILKTQKFLKSLQFSAVLKGSEDLIISSTDMAIHPSIVTTFTDHEGFRTLLVIPIICAIFLLSTLTASLIRLYIMQKHKPRRAVESSANANESSTESHINRQGSSSAL
ncbi:ciliated left-right organizer metallopeptidase-like isoform X2 [Uloborus diversus]|uniref:ciliated left-right organizer metallopeptidase-like isoform X2 n=1 Tax=Uloborus diversus TaxID=327109 RepID=UPI0024092F04|nr:ciliated left-right organizer metallopeptidase-like isoform X2 [Uloborus diversus]